MENIIYFDNSSTTLPCAQAIKNINDALSFTWGNPSSLHTKGIDAEQIISLARQDIAQLIKSSENEIYFTSGGTEANNLALFGAVNSRKKRGNRIVTTAIEHPSVLYCMKQFEKDGFEVIYLKPDINGVISEDKIKDAITKDTILVSIMLVNNEVGSLGPVAFAGNIIKQMGVPALLHTDCVQAFGKIPIDVKKLNVDLLTASAHKIHGPKGVGFLYKKNSSTISPLFFGGGQERGLRSGTEAVPMISGFGGAISELGSIETNLEKVKELWHYAKRKIEDTGLATINSPDNCLPYILNISVMGYRSETLLHALDAKNIFVSSGSACSKGNKSYVLSSMGFNAKRIDSALRISFSRYNTKEEIDIFCEALKDICSSLRKA